MVQCGPEGDPPESMVELLRHVVLRRASGRVLALLRDDWGRGLVELGQLVIAFGLGWGRQIEFEPDQPLPRGWSGVWRKSEDWLERQIFIAMSWTSNYLESGLCVQGYAFGEHPELNLGVAQQMACWFILGTCPCPTLCLTLLLQRETLAP